MSSTAKHATQDAPEDAASQLQFCALLGCDRLKRLELRRPRDIAFPRPFPPRDAERGDGFFDAPGLAGLATRLFPALEVLTLTPPGRGGSFVMRFEE